MRFAGSKTWIALALALVVAGVAYLALAGGEQGEAPAASESAVGGGEATGATGGDAQAGAQSGRQAGGEHTPEALVASFTELVAQVKGESPDHAAILAAYRQGLQALVQARDAENGTTFDEQIVAALEAGARGSLPVNVVAQVFDKLLQAAFYATIKQEIREAQDRWGDAAAVREELEEAKAFYAALAGTVAKREQAYGVELQSRVDAAFGQMEAAVADGDALAFALGWQLLDKTLMKTFYLAVGGEPHGYAFKARASADAGKAGEARKEQAEGWAFYQALRGYLERHDAGSAQAIEAALDLAGNTPDRIDPQAVHRRFVAAFAKTALDEFEETKENWGQDKAVITAYEGALFIDLVGLDLAGLLGEAAFARLSADAQAAFEAARAGDRATAEAKITAVEAVLQPLIAELLGS